MVSGDQALALVTRRIEEGVTAKQRLLADGALLRAVANAAELMIQALRNNRKILFFGNGGSSMDAGHLAAELLGRFYVDRVALPAIALADCTAAMTAIGNDYEFSQTFARQLRALAQPGDVAVGLTTSGNSPNVVQALEVARQVEMTAIALTGADGGKASQIADIVLKMPTRDTPRVQECHMLVGHTLCELIESAFTVAS